ncbi:hypothetical protein THMIRHAS_15230 [Thiosulfatimonas sediminis]|uniref:KOW domain-containing protein n=3 Tax=Thiosulfatimonas sediminis TaxID=2675054 RepID=A0A6F8PW02_9GAMM|nr:hypothetical protein [Thiosulfatimonas sediminis]BBP45455.1 hypothetical protein THMIRHAS_08280 [Thiosulfatimonas sediminis]BBP45640.1 hypothetical protein THMIRHAS_10130 [Thiosulfatimonas sediminis]BBP46150.1 hypothetical protein THMIRHAS_15230 [Thiosulfatimonas sediminis]
MRIEDMTLDQLMELNTLICQRIDQLQERETMEALMQLRLGMKVTFEGRYGQVFGIVTKINRKTVIVLDEDGAKQYKVAPVLLRPLHEAS